jgi:hypothetical protein
MSHYLGKGDLTRTLRPSCWERALARAREPKAETLFRVKYRPWCQRSLPPSMLLLHTTRLTSKRGWRTVERSRVSMRLCKTSQARRSAQRELARPFKPVIALHLHARHDTGRSPDLQTIFSSTAAQDPQRTALPSGSALSANGIPCSAVLPPRPAGLVQCVL